MKSDSENSEVDDRSLDSILVENGAIVEELRNTIGAKLRGDSPLPASCCIFRVPKLLLRQNRAAYEPDIVSIGPFHRGHGGEQFQLMENVKRWYLQCLLSSTGISLESLIKGIMKFYKRARNCYAEPFDHLSQSDFIEMLILDGCFLLELFRKGLCADLQDENDPIFNAACMQEYLYHDLLLLENQFPWFVLEYLYNLTKETNQEDVLLTELVRNFFSQSEADDGLLNSNLDLPYEIEILHILDLIRTLIVSSFEDLESLEKERRQDQQQKNETALPQRIPNATTLSEAGVEFRKSTNTPNCIMNIHFKNGVLTIPPLRIEESTGPLFRNLVAFEQCYHSRLHKITSYAVLMDNLIDSSKDIDLLCEKGILGNWLSAEDASKFFNELYNDTAVIGYYYNDLCNDVNKYYNTDWNKWIEKLRREYFSTPWAVISLVAAFILLVLTFLQTVYTIQQYYCLDPPKYWADFLNLIEKPTTLEPIYYLDRPKYKDCLNNTKLGQQEAH